MKPKARIIVSQTLYVRFPMRLLLEFYALLPFLVSYKIASGTKKVTKVLN
ncbi:hypothetical protein GCM10007390_44250 [Persicitalea jodogahamensis]|uniref:Uncharacterized protein n=1 Tax=Persicitalea jodogahamensis TaxID=402147 RepID=A0A8J3DCV1_9BACT|nr:hypothetical protein GCM10007390_44250 [Persicitalea jodogahamensis]